MSRHPATTLLAMPGDPDLDADVDCLTVTRFEADVNTRTLTVYLTDGFGRFVDTTGGTHDCPPGDLGNRAGAATVTAALTEATPEAWAEAVTTLRRWWNTRMPVRLCAAPGRYTVLIEDRNTFLLFPRNRETQP